MPSDPEDGTTGPSRRKLRGPYHPTGVTTASSGREGEESRSSSSAPEPENPAPESATKYREAKIRFPVSPDRPEPNPSLPPPIESPPPPIEQETKFPGPQQAHQNDGFLSGGRWGLWPAIIGLATILVVLAGLVAIFVGGDDEGGDSARAPTMTSTTPTTPTTIVEPNPPPPDDEPISLQTLKRAGDAKATVTLKNVGEGLLLTVKSNVPQDDYRVYLAGPGRQAKILATARGPGSGTWRGTWRNLSRYNTVFVDLVVRIEVRKRRGGTRTITREPHILSASVDGIIRKSDVKLIAGD